MQVITEKRLEKDADGAYRVPEGTPVAVREPVKRNTRITPPKGADPEVVQTGNEMIFSFPQQSVVQTETVDRFRLGLVISLAVTFICLWGTLIGSMLPLFFRRIGADPALASSPFVATFVDVTGIAVYFKVATWILL